MIEAGFQFPISARRLVIETFLSLPEALRPTYRSDGEEDVGVRIRDVEAILTAVDQRKTGFFLKNEIAVYSIRMAGDEPLLCDCFLEVKPAVVKDFMRHMAEAQPDFGFACRKAEREHQNQITTKLGANLISSWVGRDTQKYIPGLYWLTLLPAALAKRHNVALASLEEAAVDHEVLSGDQYLFQFFDNPDDWDKTDNASSLISSTPGIFDPEKARARLMGAKSFLDLNALTRELK